jgi:hypothetical protein
MVEPTLASARVARDACPVDMVTALRSYAREYRDGGYADADRARVRSGQAIRVSQSLMLIPDVSER